MNKINYFTISGLLCLTFLICSLSLSNAQNPPKYYWTFDGVSPLKDSIGQFSLNTTAYNCIYSIDNPVAGSVGKSLKLDKLGRLIGAPQLVLDSILVIEFMFKPALNFNTTQFMNRRDNAFIIKMGYPFIQFTTNILSPSGAAINHTLKVDLEGIGRATYGYYTDGNWHHLVFKYNTVSGKKEIWVDGQLADGFSAVTASGLFNKNATTPTQNEICINSLASYYKFFGNLDELAFYNKELSSSNIYQHYLNTLQQNHYSFANSTISVPPADAVSAHVDINEFAPGHPNYNVGAAEQLARFPLPRYKSNHTLAPNFNWLGLNYLAGEFQPGVSKETAVSNSIKIQKELAGNFNYYLLVSGNTSNSGQYNDTTKFHGAWVKLANDNPQWPSSAISFWAQLNPSAFGFSSTTGYIENKTLPAQHYLRNSSGQYISLSGTVSAAKYWSPAAPVDSFMNDGITQQLQLRRLTQALTRPLDFICENGEVIPKPSINAMSQDPSVSIDKAVSGFSDWESYLGNRKRNLATMYRDQFLTMPQLANTIYAEYQICGHPTAHHKYSETRHINSTPTGKHYATPDFYPRWPSNWLTGTSAWNGWQDIVDGRYHEIQQNDKLFSPFVSAGWNIDEERNIRPAQWLGLLKCMNMLGAEYFFSGFFNEAASYMPPNAPPARPEGYVWQAVIPAYAQAIASRYETLLRDGYVMPGDVPNSYTSPTAPGYAFEAGDQRKLVVVRKHNTDNIYAITGTIQPNSNMAGNTEIESDATIQLDGATMKFKIRRQGSTYIYDKSDPSSPVFYQLDEWHENTHPYKWTKEFNLEAELSENTSSSFAIKTDRAAGTAAGDFRNSTSYVVFYNTSDALNLSFENRETSSYFLWVRARSADGSPTGINITLNNSISKSIGCITDTTWKWYSIDVCSHEAIAYQNLGPRKYTLSITASNVNMEIDKVFLSQDSQLQLNANQPACNNAIASVTSSGATGFCPGGSVVLTASYGTGYLWSGGQTTKSITVTASGTYSVTVNNGNGCFSVSPAVVIEQFTPQPPVIATSGSLNICSGDSVILSSPNAAGNLWSTTDTSQSITVKNNGTYSLTTTDDNGCSATAAASVTVNADPVASISPSDTINIVTGQTAILTAGGGTDYLWTPGNQTTSSITVDSSGLYSVEVMNASGCSSTATTFVNVTSQLNAQITVQGNNYICPGSSVMLASDSAHSYLWQPGGLTARTINVTQAGTYSLTITDAYGNTASQSITIAAATEPAAPAVSINYIPNTAYQLTAFEASAVNYYWSNGQTSATINVSTPDIYSVTITNGYGCESEATEIDVNSINGQPCGQADMLTAYNISASSATLAWNPAVTADAFTVKVWEQGTSVVKSYNVAGNESSFEVTGLNENTSYNFEVITHCVNLTQVSDPSTFNTITSVLSCGSIPAGPYTNNINTTKALLNWYPTAASTFTVRYRPVGVVKYRYRIYDATQSQSSGLLTNLTPNTMYEWAVQSHCNGIITDYSDPVYFTTIDTCGYPGLVSVLVVNPTNATISWTNLSSMDTVRIRVKNMANGTDRNWYVTGNPGQFTINKLKPNTLYLVDVQGKCSSGALSSWTQKVIVNTSTISGRIEDENPFGLNGYPNPASSVLNYTFESEDESDYVLKVCDMAGRELLQEVRATENGANSDEINVNNYTPGFYIMIIQKGSQTSRFRFAVN